MKKPTFSEAKWEKALEENKPRQPLKKLASNRGVKLSSTLGGQRELVREMRNTINDIIDALDSFALEYLAKKEEPKQSDWRDKFRYIFVNDDDTLISDSPVVKNKIESFIGQVRKEAVEDTIKKINRMFERNTMENYYTLWGKLKNRILKY